MSHDTNKNIAQNTHTHKLIFFFHIYICTDRGKNICGRNKCLICQIYFPSRLGQSVNELTDRCTKWETWKYFKDFSLNFWKCNCKIYISIEKFFSKWTWTFSFFSSNLKNTSWHSKQCQSIYIVILCFPTLTFSHPNPHLLF